MMINNDQKSIELIRIVESKAPWPTRYGLLLGLFLVVIIFGAMQTVKYPEIIHGRIISTEENRLTVKTTNNIINSLKKEQIYEVQLYSGKNIPLKELFLKIAVFYPLKDSCIIKFYYDENKNISNREYIGIKIKRRVFHALFLKND